jgi:hypothetical protein
VIGVIGVSRKDLEVFVREGLNGGCALACEVACFLFPGGYARIKSALTFLRGNISRYEQREIQLKFSLDESFVDVPTNYMLCAFAVLIQRPGMGFETGAGVRSMMSEEAEHCRSEVDAAQLARLTKKPKDCYLSST